MNARPIHSLTFLRQVEDAIWARLGRRVLLDDLSATDLEKIWFQARDPRNASDRYLGKTLNEILGV